MLDTDFENRSVANFVEAQRQYNGWLAGRELHKDTGGLLQQAGRDFLICHTGRSLGRRLITGTLMCILPNHRC